MSKENNKKLSAWEKALFVGLILREVSLGSANLALSEEIPYKPTKQNEITLVANPKQSTPPVFQFKPIEAAKFDVTTIDWNTPQIANFHRDFCVIRRPAPGGKPSDPDGGEYYSVVARGDERRAWGTGVSAMFPFTDPSFQRRKYEAMASALPPRDRVDNYNALMARAEQQFNKVWYPLCESETSQLLDNQEANFKSHPNDEWPMPNAILVYNIGLDDKEDIKGQLLLRQVDDNGRLKPFEMPLTYYHFRVRCAAARRLMGQLKQRMHGKGTRILVVTSDYPRVLFMEMAKDGIFRDITPEVISDFKKEVKIQNERMNVCKTKTYVLKNSLDQDDQGYSRLYFRKKNGQLILITNPQLEIPWMNDIAPALGKPKTTENERNLKLSKEINPAAARFLINNDGAKNPQTKAEKKGRRIVAEQRYAQSHSSGSSRVR